MILKSKKKWLKLNSGLLSFAMLLSTISPVISPSTAQAAVSASGPTVSQPKPVELPWYRNETTKVFGNPDGTLTAEVYSEPIHYLEGNHWFDIDNTLDSTVDGKSETNRANHFNVKFPKNPKEKDLTRLFDYSIAGKNITFGLSNTLSKNQNSHVSPQDIVGEFQGNNAKFSNLYPPTVNYPNTDVCHIKLSKYYGNGVNRCQRLQNLL